MIYSDDLQSPYMKLFDPPLLLDDNIPFGPALPANVEVSPVAYGYIDDFINDLVTCGYLDSNQICLAGAALLSLHILNRSLLPGKPVTRDNLVALTKLKAEGRLAEIKTILGQELNTC